VGQVAQHGSWRAVASGTLIVLVSARLVLSVMTVAGGEWRSFHGVDTAPS
jgi:hypothetical protein